MNSKHNRLVAFVLLVSLLAGSLSAQIVIDSSHASGSIRPLDRPIDPDTYLIRPGERLEVVFLNAKVSPLNLTVNPEGRIIHRDLGVIVLSGKTLAEARALLLAPLSSLYNVSEIVISTKTIYPVAIKVLGMVAHPGTYFGYTSQTVRELIDSAGGILPGGSIRTISFTGGPEDIKVDLDLATYAVSNDYATSDPCLYAGTKIIVHELSQAPVTIFGEVTRPRVVELLPGEDINRLLELAGGVRNTGDQAGAYAVNDPNRDIHQPGGIVAGDRIRVPAMSDRDGSGEVIITGAVTTEGRHYSITDATSLSDLITAAGGLTSEANRDRIVVFRKTGFHGLEIRAEARYPIWVQADQLMSVTLERSDSVHVPTTLRYVEITGLVARPGMYPYFKGQEVADYIVMAGGTTTALEPVLEIFDRVAGITRIAALKAVVYDGDRIIVGEREVGQ